METHHLIETQSQGVVRIHCQGPEVAPVDLYAAAIDVYDYLADLGICSGAPCQICHPER